MSPMLGKKQIEQIEQVLQVAKSYVSSETHFSFHKTRLRNIFVRLPGMAGRENDFGKILDMFFVETRTGFWF